MLSLSVIVAERIQTGDGGVEVASTAVITHRHGDHFWPAADGPEEAPPPDGLFLIRLGRQLSGRRR